MNRFDRQAGVTLVELITVVALAAVMAVTTVGYSVPWLARQSLTSGLHDVHSFMQLAKIEAASRNRPCRFVFDSSDGEFEILDSLGTPSTSDDVSLHTGRLPGSLVLARPDGGAALTLDEIGSSEVYQTVFGADGVVNSGSGAVFLFGGEHFGRVSVFGAGGTEIASWNGSSWELGT